MKVSELFNIKEDKKKSKIWILLLITGALSLLIAVITVYGQYTGNYLISITKQAQKKGIAISETNDFNELKSDIKFKPLNDLTDISESWLDIGEAENTDGQYYTEGLEYIAFTFYLKNTGDETINVNYQIKVLDDYKNIGLATIFKVREYVNINNEFRLKDDINYSKAFNDNKDTIASVDILGFRTGEVRKFTFFVWFDGEYSKPEMMGGAIKFDWVFGITSSLEEGDVLLEN